jgi:predicted ATPase
VSAVGELCRRLDGIPLAIELAAVWVRTLGVTQILERLDDRFRLLSKGSPIADRRHRTLRAAFDWSFERLSFYACLAREGTPSPCRTDART